MFLKTVYCLIKKDVACLGYCLSSWKTIFASDMHSFCMRPVGEHLQETQATQLLLLHLLDRLMSRIGIKQFMVVLLIRVFHLSWHIRRVLASVTFLWGI